MASPLIVKGIKRERFNRYDYVSVSTDREIISVRTSEGGVSHSRWADLTPEGAAKLIVALQLAIAKCQP